MKKNSQTTLPQSTSNTLNHLFTTAVFTSLVAIAMVAFQGHESIHDNYIVQEIATSTSEAASMLRELYFQTLLPESNQTLIVKKPVVVTNGQDIVAEIFAVDEIVEGISADDDDDSGSLLSTFAAANSRCADIVEWMASHGAHFPNVELVVYEGEHRGMHAKHDINVGDSIMSIPEHLIITYKTAKASDIGVQITNALPDSYIGMEQSHYYIALFLLQERALGRDSFWFHYLNTLPTEFTNMVVNFTPDEIKLLKESNLGSMYENDVSRLRSEWDEVCGALPDFCQRHSLQDYTWARLVVRSRAFSLAVDGVDYTALMPFADMVNHDFSNLASWRFQHDDRTGEIFSRQPIAKGTPITISYGAKSNRVLFSTYGFAIRDNPNDVATVFLQLPDGESASGMLARRVAKSGNPDTEFWRISHSISSSTDDEGFIKGMSLCRVAVAISEELEMMENGDKPISLRNEAEALRCVSNGIDAALYKYAQAIDVDEALLASERLSSNELNAVLVRHGEKNALINMISNIDNLLALVDPAVSVQEFNRIRFQKQFAPHMVYIRNLVELRRSMKTFN